MRKTFLMLLAWSIMSFANAGENVSPLPADQAFAFSAYLDQRNELILEWNIAPGYYLYRNQLRFKPAPLNHVGIEKIHFPAGQSKYDKLHGHYEAYTGSVKIPIALISSKKGILNLNIHYQGCSSAGFCYTPIKKSIKVDLARISAAENLNQYVQNTDDITKPDDDFISKFFGEKNLFLMILSFLSLGLLLAFTPCVLPMVPILSGIIVGHGKKSNKQKSFFLSLSYVSGMAITYAIAGIVIALIGSSIQAQLQKTWIIILFSGLFVLLALSLFGWYELQLPARFQRKITAFSNQQSGGTYVGVFLMGCLSTLIVSPCVSAPLVGVLAYIGQTGDVLLGSLAFLALGIGMGIPLLLIGVSADKFLPKAGPWMAAVERIFGFIMLGLAIWMLSRMIPGPVTLFLWAILFIAAAIFFGIFSPICARARWVSTGLSVAMLTYGIILMIGSVKGNSDIFNPWAQFKNTLQHPESKSIFKIVQSMDELEQQFAYAKNLQKPVILDFYADWCSSCVTMDRTIFSREDIQQTLKNWVLLRMDLTKNTALDQAISKRFHVVGPPTIIFFNAEGQELMPLRIVGEVNAKEFLRRSARANK
ncbi:MAG TPA: protein-disulfide reductase DsbD [Gammaproteobacteria bacterium]|nr:protein-disulfide reductase DsbD [Gammaproteobacteria bacterium]